MDLFCVCDQHEDLCLSSMFYPGMDLYLVENEIDRWSISDRTPGLVYGDDGSLTITLSAARPEGTANWLPVPSGRYMLGMRVYEGDDAVIACDWFPPPLTAVPVQNSQQSPRSSL